MVWGAGFVEEESRSHDHRTMDGAGFVGERKGERAREKKLKYAVRVARRAEQVQCSAVLVAKMCDGDQVKSARERRPGVPSSDYGGVSLWCDVIVQATVRPNEIFYRR